MDILIVKPLEKPVAVKIDGSLEEMKRIVGGRIQVMYPFEDSVAIVCDAPLWSTRFLSLSAEQLERYSSLFSVPEVFIQGKSRLLIIPCK